MYSPETDELKRKFRRVATVAVVIILIVFPVYMLVIKDSGGPTTPPRIDRERLQAERESADPEAVDTIEQPVTRERERTRETETRQDIAARERRDPAPQPEIEPEPEPEREVTPRRPPPAPAIAGDENINFPETPEGRNITQSYLIRNTGNRPLEVRNISISGENEEDFSLISGESIVIGPNESRAVDIEFAPLTTGAKRAVLQIESNDPRMSSMQIALRGEATGEEAVESIVQNMYNEGYEYFRSRRYNSAEEMYSNVLSIDPHNGPAYLMRGRSRYEQGDYLAAISDFDQVLKYRLSIPSDDRQRVECISLYYAALSMTESALRTENESEQQRLLRPAMGRWEDFKGLCNMDETLVENAGFWMSRLSELR